MDVILHEQAHMLEPSVVDCEECILRKRGKSLVKICKSCVLIHTLAGEYRLLWEIEGTDFNSHEVPLSATLPE